MEIKSDTTIGDIVKVNFKTAQLFDRNNIDFCCGGGTSLAEACKKSGVEINELIPELQLLVQVSDPDSKYIDSLELDELCEYIEKRHHTYVSENVPFINQKLQKLCDVHGSNHTELFEIKKLFDEAAGNLTEHMKKEESVLFPYIKKIVKGQSESINESGELKAAIDSIREMEEEHEAEGERFEKISTLSNTYTCPPDGCNTYQVTFQMLKDFEQDLHRHIHLENNILFKKVVILKEELTE